ncbi:MAG: cobalamin-binding protein [Pseudomonadota bacterium]
MIHRTPPSWGALFGLLFALSGLASADPRCVTQSDAAPLCIEEPARRVVSLAPHLTEMLFAIEAQDRIAGVVERSDYPEEARRLANVGPFHSPDLERLLALRPDLIVSWSTGTPAAHIARLRELGFKIWIARSEHLDDIPDELRALGMLTGHPAEAERVASSYARDLQTLRQHYATRPALKGFYEIWPQPLITVGDGHFIAESMRVCGILNIVGATASNTPSWSEEAVIRAAPDLLLTSPPARDFERWRRWTALPAVRNNALFVMPPDVLMRPGPRLIDGVRALCEAADKARAGMQP